VARAYKDKQEIENIQIFHEFKRRLNEGFRLMVSLAVYYIIPICLSMLGYILIVSQIELGSSLNIFLLLSGLIFLTLGLILYIIVNIFISPLVSAKVVNKESYTNIWNLQSIWEDLKMYWKDLLMIFLGIYIGNLLFSMAFYVSILSIFICLGIFVVPIVGAVGIVYLQHIQAELIGNFAKHLDKND
jgi:hypothetical protein